MSNGRWLAAAAAVLLAADVQAAGGAVSFDGARGDPALALPSFDFSPGRAPMTPMRLSPAPLARGGRCGVERWAVKTLSDADAGAVNPTPVDSSVSALSKNPGGSPWAAPANGGYSMPPDRRLLSGPYAETQAYRVRATLTTYKLENDQDIHLVLTDPRTGDTLVAESVDPTCPGADASASSGAFSRVRRQLKDMVFQGRDPQPGQFNQVSIPVTLVGVRFFDPPHGQNGASDNGSELHPVLCLSTGSDCD